MDSIQINKTSDETRTRKPYILHIDSLNKHVDWVIYEIMYAYGIDILRFKIFQDKPANINNKYRLLTS